ncbi:MAG: DALR domain-containing protein, partial [Armatimonadaceae bacterium]
SDTGKEFAHTWMHNGLLSLRDKDGKLTKMAGSLGNVLNVTDALKHMGGEALRFFFLSTHYRSPIDLGVWDWKNPATPLPEGMVASKKAFDTFVRFAERVERVLGEPFAALSTAFDPNSTRVTVDTKLLRRFHEHMADDFNTGGAVGVLFELVSRLNKLADDKKLEEQAGAQVAAVAEFRAGVLMLKEFADILGLTFTPNSKTLGEDDKLVAGLMQLLLDLRANLRATAKEAAKDNPLKKALFDQTDLIRTRLADLGVTLEDRPAGTSWRVG